MLLAARIIQCRLGHNFADLDKRLDEGHVSLPTFLPELHLFRFVKKVCLEQLSLFARRLEATLQEGWIVVFLFVIW